MTYKRAPVQKISYLWSPYPAGALPLRGGGAKVLTSSDSPLILTVGGISLFAPVYSLSLLRQQKKKSIPKKQNAPPTAIPIMAGNANGGSSPSALLTLVGDVVVCTGAAVGGNVESAVATEAEVISTKIPSFESCSIET